MNKSNAVSRRLNVLVLDGGGVRGLSSLLILQALMVQINDEVTSLQGSSSELHPHHVFRLVAGTSTGGLIALMLGKMGMTVDDCITQYQKLSKVVFGKKHFGGRITHGLAPARYSGKRLRNCVRELLRHRHLDEDLPMANQDDKVACAVICREHCSSSQYSKLKRRPVPICSLPCKDNLLCKVCDAARATSAAPTFFPVTRIEDRFLSDGGLGSNNPSFAIYFHYHRIESKKSAGLGADVPTYAPHGDLDCSSLRFTNIGTGAKAVEVEPGKRDRLATLIPGVIRKGVFLKQTLTEIAVDSERIAVIMRTFGHLNENDIMYERFDANHGVSNIRLDDHNALRSIQERTEQYLDEQGTKDLLKEVGSAIAKDYHEQNVQLTGSAIGTLHPQVKASNPTSALSSQSSHLSSHYPESETHDVSPNHNEVQNGGPEVLTEHPIAKPLPLDAQGHFAHENPKNHTVGSKTEILTALS